MYYSVITLCVSFIYPDLTGWDEFVSLIKSNRVFFYNLTIFEFAEFLFITFSFKCIYQQQQKK